MKHRQSILSDKQKSAEDKILQEKYLHIMELVQQGIEKKFPILPIGNWIDGLEKPTYQVEYSEEQLQKIAAYKKEIEAYVHRFNYTDERKQGMFMKKL